MAYSCCVRESVGVISWCFKDSTGLGHQRMGDNCGECIDTQVPFARANMTIAMRGEGIGRVVEVDQPDDGAKKSLGYVKSAHDRLGSGEVMACSMKVAGVKAHS